MRKRQSRYQDFDHDSFYPALSRDLRQATGSGIILSPYLRVRKVAELRPDLEDCVRRGVRLCVLVQRQYVPEPSSDDGPEKQFKIAEAAKLAKSTEQAGELLLAMGVHVTYRRKVHQKIIVIDEDIAWTGSLNSLSHLDTSEEMTRWRSRTKVNHLVRKHKLYTCEMCPQPLIVAPKGSVSDDLVSIGLSLKNRRMLLELKQSELLAESTIAQSTLSLIEQGLQDAKLTTIAKICRLLNCDVRVIPRFLTSAVDQLIASSESRLDSTASEGALIQAETDT